MEISHANPAQGMLVGKTNWGGLVSVLRCPEFIDGGVVTAPKVGFFDEKGFGSENVGTPPQRTDVRIIERCKAGLMPGFLPCG